MPFKETQTGPIVSFLLLIALNTLIKPVFYFISGILNNR